MVKISTQSAERQAWWWMQKGILLLSFIVVRNTYLWDLPPGFCVCQPFWDKDVLCRKTSGEAFWWNSLPLSFLVFIGGFRSVTLQLKSSCFTPSKATVISSSPLSWSFACLSVLKQWRYKEAGCLLNKIPEVTESFSVHWKSLQPKSLFSKSDILL